MKFLLMESYAWKAALLLNGTCERHSVCESDTYNMLKMPRIVNDYCAKDKGELPCGNSPLWHTERWFARS